MRFSKPMSRPKIINALSLVVMALSTLVASALPTYAQPPDTIIDVQVIARDWEALHDATELQEIRDPRSAIARYQNFYEARARQLPATAIAVASLIAQLYWQELHDEAKAVAVYEAALEEFEWFKGSYRLERELEQMQSGKPRVEPLRILPLR